MRPVYAVTVEEVLNRNEKWSIAHHSQDWGMLHVGKIIKAWSAVNAEGWIGIDYETVGKWGGTKITGKLFKKDDLVLIVRDDD